MFSHINTTVASGQRINNFLLIMGKFYVCTHKHHSYFWVKEFKVLGSHILVFYT